MKLNRAQTWAQIGVVTLCVIATGAWQYAKFTNQHGLYYRINPEHGDVVLLVAHAALLALGLCWLLWGTDE